MSRGREHELVLLGFIYPLINWLILYSTGPIGFLSPGGVILLAFVLPTVTCAAVLVRSFTGARYHFGAILALVAWMAAIGYGNLWVLAQASASV
jgi:hypothetical protein